MSNWSNLLSWLNFLEIHPKPMSCGCRRLQGFCMTCGFIFSFWRKKTPAKKCQAPAKNVKLAQIPKSHTNIFFWNPPDHIIDCKPYDTCKVTEKFVATPGILNFTRKPIKPWHQVPDGFRRSSRLRPLIPFACWNFSMPSRAGRNFSLLQPCTWTFQLPQLFDTFWQ